MTTPQRAFSSAACKVFLGADAGALGPELGWATGVRITEGANLFPVDILGDVYTQRYEPTSVKFSGSFDAVHMLSKPLSAYRANGRSLFFQGDTRDIILFEPTTLVLVDQVRGENVIMVDGWTPESRVWSISYGNIMSVSVSFVATRVTEYVVNRGFV